MAVEGRRQESQGFKTRMKKCQQAAQQKSGTKVASRDWDDVRTSNTRIT